MGKNASGKATYDFNQENGKMKTILVKYWWLNLTYDANNNVIESIERSDTTPVHHTYVWEEGPGTNARAAHNDTQPKLWHPCG